MTINSTSRRLTAVVRPSILTVVGKVMDVLVGAIGIFLIRGAGGIFGLNF